MDKAVIFDMDGVLVNTEPLYFENGQRVFNALGIEVSHELHLTFVGISSLRQWNLLKEKYGLDQPVEELMEMEADGQCEIAFERDLEPIPGIVPLIDDLLQPGIRRVIASSSPRRLVEIVLEKTGLKPFFRNCVTGDEVQAGKPDPDIFNKAAALVGVQPGRCLVIEDSPHGIAGAHAAGMKAVGFQNPDSGDQDLSEADLLIPDFSRDSRSRILDLFDEL